MSRRVERALLSVSDKTGLLEYQSMLKDLVLESEFIGEERPA